MVKGYTLEQVRGFYKQTYGAGRSRLYVVGRFDAPAVEAAIRKAFAGWEKGSEPAQPPAEADVDARGAHHRSPRRAAVDGHPGRADGRSVETLTSSR